MRKVRGESLEEHWRGIKGTGRRRDAPFAPSLRCHDDVPLSPRISHLASLSLFPSSTPHPSFRLTLSLSFSLPFSPFMYARPRSFLRRDVDVRRRSLSPLLPRTTKVMPSPLPRVRDRDGRLHSSPVDVAPEKLSGALIAG